MATEKPYTAGFFYLNLDTLDHRKRDHVNIAHRAVSLRKKLETKAIEKESALRNLLGICVYAIDEYEQAYQEFDAILRQDPENLNALEHLKATLKKLGRPEEAQPLEQRIRVAMESNENIGLMLLEQAHAKTFELYEKANQERYLTSIELYEQGLDYVQKLALAERVEWMMCHGIAYHKLLDLLYHSKNDRLIKKTYSGALKVFQRACKLAKGLDSEYMCWSYMGLILSKTPKNPDNIDRNFIRDNGLAEWAENPEICFEKALELKPNNKEATCRYAGHVLLKQRNSADLRKILKLLTAVVDARPPDLNWFVYCRRAEVLFAIYELERPADKTYLRQALEDYKMVDKKNKKDAENVKKIERYLAE